MMVILKLFISNAEIQFKSVSIGNLFPEVAQKFQGILSRWPVLGSSVSLIGVEKIIQFARVSSF